MKKLLLLVFLCLSFYGKAQTQFWSDTFEDTGAPSSGARTASVNAGAGGPPYTSYFLRSDGSDLNLMAPYTNTEGSKFWAGEDLDGAGVGNGTIPQSLTWSGINISGKTGLSFKGLFACWNTPDPTNPTYNNYEGYISFPTNYDFIIVEYRIDGGSWNKIIEFYSDRDPNGVFKLDTDGNLLGDGAYLTKAFSEFSANIPGTGSTLDLRYNLSVNNLTTEEVAIDNFRLFSAPSCPTVSASIIAQTNIACNGGSNGSATVSASGGSGFTYSWSPSGGTSATASGLSAGTYTCTVTNSCLNTATANVTITQPTALSLTASSQTNIACNGGSNGAASVNAASGGAGGYTYNWTPGNPTGDGTTSVSGLSAGTWTCTVTDANACTRSVNFTVTQPTALSLTASSQTNIACNGGSSGAASVNTASGGAGGYTYNWTPGNPTGDGTTSVSGLTAGTWTCTVTDANACTRSVNFTVTQPTALSLTASSQTNIACNGGSSGAASVNTASGGAGGYTYNWTPGNPTGDGTTSVSGLTAGTWTCTVTDANACTGSVSFTVTQPTALSLTASSQTNIACNGGSSGAASVNAASGGAGGYTYNWTPGNPTGDGTTSVSGLTAGTWTCTVTDANACTGSVNFTVTQPTALSLTASSQTNISCNGGSNGAASVNAASGGAGGYTYNWTPGNPTGDGTTSVSGLTAGTWTCTVTDANACTGSVNFTVTQPTALSLTASSQTNIACNGGSNGAASVNAASGGAGGYTYNWTPGNPTGDGTTSVSGLSAGTWTCTVTDANACTGSVNFTVTQPTALSLTASSQTNISCNGGSNGAASVNAASGGAGGYTYNWTPGNPTGDGTTSVSGLSAGTWTCTVTDANACTGSVNFTVTQPTALSLTASSQTNIACNGGSNGAASVNAASGGAGDYTYNWTPGNPTGDGTTSVSGLTAGTWTCTVTDANACTQSVNFTITEPTSLSISAASQTNIACNGGSDGAASVNAASGGAGDYTYNWTPGNPTGDGTTSVSGLTAGTWTCTVTDANACTQSVNFTITEPTSLSMSAASQTNIACNGGSDGAASVNAASGGAGDYTYNWTPGNPTGDGTTSVSGLSAGDYTVTVTDANSCTATQSFTITEPEALSATSTTSNAGCSDDGSASVTVAGGTPDYTYSWSPSGGTAASATGLAQGSYTVSIGDANGCTLDHVLTIGQDICTGILNEQDADAVTVYPNPASDVLYIESPFRTEKVTVYNAAGHRVDCEFYGNTIKLDHLGAGIYIVQLITDKGTVYKKILVE